MKSNAPQDGKRRAATIHRQVEALKAGALKPKSPAEFVHRRMQELAGAGKRRGANRGKAHKQ
jgi:hypothetical protein